MEMPVICSYLPKEKGNIFGHVSTWKILVYVVTIYFGNIDDYV